MFHINQLDRSCRQLSIENSHPVSVPTVTNCFDICLKLLDTTTYNGFTFNLHNTSNGSKDVYNITEKNGLSNSKRTIYDRLIQAVALELPGTPGQQGRQGRGL